MPRASWRGFLRLSLVSCPIYLSPATSRTKPIRLRQVWRPGLADEGDQSPEPERPTRVTEPSLPDLGRHDGGDDADQPQPLTRVTIRPHDPRTGEEIDKAEVVKGYEYGRGQFVTFTPEELKALDVESSKVIDLEKFVPRGDLDPVYLDTPYYLYPDGPVAEETLAGDRRGDGRGRRRRARAAHAQPARADGRGRASRRRHGALHVARCRRGPGGAVRWRREGSRRRDGRDRARDHRSADRKFRSDDVSRPLPGGLARAD